MPNSLRGYRLRSSNIPGLDGEAMYEEVFNVQMPYRIRRSVDFRNGGRPRRQFREFQPEQLQTLSWQSSKRFTTLEALSGMRYIGGLPNAEGTNSLEFTLTAVYEEDELEPGAPVDQLEPLLLAVTDARITVVPDPLAEQDGGQHAVNCWLYSYIGYRSAIIDPSLKLIEFSEPNRIFKIWVPDDSGDPDSYVELDLRAEDALLFPA